MKQIFTSLFLFLSFILFAQKENSEILNVSKVKYMAVYSGCENSTDSKMDLVRCFGSKFSADLLVFLDTDFPVTPESIDKDQLKAKINFVVGSDGYIHQVEMVDGDRALEAQALNAFSKLNSYMKQNGKKIKPARTEKGEEVDLIFTNSVVLQNPYNEKERLKEKKRMGLHSS